MMNVFVEGLFKLLTLINHFFKFQVDGITAYFGLLLMLFGEA